MDGLTQLVLFAVDDYSVGRVDAEELNRRIAALTQPTRDTGRDAEGVETGHHDTE